MLPPISEQLFAQINNDPFLAGSPLEGLPFGVAPEYLLSYLETLKISAPLEVIKLLKAFRDMSSYVEAIKKAQQGEECLEDTAVEIQNRLKELKRGDYILLPGGWEGHSMIYKLELDSSSTLLFQIYNSGGGLEYHAQKSGLEQELYDPVLTYSIPSSKIEHPSFLFFLNQLLTIRVHRKHKKDNIDAKYLYEQIFPRLSYVDGKITKNLNSKFIIPQLSGTCTVGCLYVLLESCFPNLDEFRRFIYFFKGYSIDEYMAQLKESGLLKNPQQQSPVIKAIQHQLSLLNRNQSENTKESLFPMVTKEAEAKKLVAYLSELHPVESHQEQLIPLTEEQAQAEALVTPIYLRKPTNPWLTSPASNENAFNPNYTPPPPLQSLTLDVLDQWITHAHQRAEKHETMELFLELEELFTSLPIPDSTYAKKLHPFYSSIDSPEKASLLYQKMLQLQTLYFNTCPSLLGRIISVPRLYVVKLSTFVIAGYIESFYPLSSTLYYPYTAQRITDLFTIESSRDLACNNPRFDYRLREIEELDSRLRNPHDTPPRTFLTSYYNNILDKEPVLKSRLANSYLDAYKESNSQIHDQVRTEDCTALYYLITHYAELKEIAEFKPLLRLLEQQDHLERLYCFHSLRFTEHCVHISKDISHPLKMEIGKDSLLDLCSTGNPPLMGTRLTTEVSFKYKKSIPQRNLRAQKTQRNFANTIQVTYPPSSNYLKMRALEHIRLLPESQIFLSLELFTQHPDWLAQTSYIEANLFQSDLLLQILKDKEKNPVFFTLFKSLIYKGMNHFEKKGHLTDNSLSLIRLSYLVYDYAYQYQASYEHELTKFYEQLNKYLSSERNQEIRATLHQYRLLTWSRLFKGQQELPPNLIQEGLESYFYQQAYTNPHHHLDQDSLFHIDCAKHQCKKLLEKTSDQLDLSMMGALLKEVGIPLKNLSSYTIKGKYPILGLYQNEVLHYQFDLNQGLLIKEGFAYTPTPKLILDNPIVRKFNLETQLSCFMATSSHGPVTLLEKDALQLRLFNHKDSKNRLVIQKKWTNAEGQEEWYELILTPEQNQFWQGENDKEPMELNLGILLERDNLLWRSLSSKKPDQFVISDTANQIYCEGIIGQEGRCFKLHPQRKELLSLGKKPSWLHNQISAFEDPQFITTWLGEQQSQICLPRYRLNFEIENKSRTTSWRYNSEPYILEPNTSIFKPGVSHLTFNHKDKAQSLCLVPIQPFISTGIRAQEHEYYQLCQDSQGEIQKKLWEKGHSDLLACWQHSDTQAYLVFPLIDGEPSPQTSEDALYLCYLYLGSNQTDKAWLMLARIGTHLGGFSGSYQSLMYLHWIIKGLPYSTKPQEQEHLSAPQHVACQLKAMALLCEYAQSGKIITFPKHENISPLDANGYVTNLLLEERKRFYQNVPEDIYKLYTRLQAMKPALTQNYTLKDKEKRDLLDYYYRSQPQKDGPVALGALGFEWMKLHLLIIKKECNELITQRKLRPLTTYEEKRLREITRFRKEYLQTYQHASELEYIPIDLSFPAGIDIKQSMLSAESKQIITNLGGSVFIEVQEADLEEAIQALHSGMSEDALIQYLSRYIKIMTTINHPLQTELTQFCKATLIAYRHTPLNQQSTNMPLLCSFLYHIKNQKLPQKLDASFWKFHSWINFARPFQPEPIIVPQLKVRHQNILGSSISVWHTHKTRKPVRIKPTKSKAQAPYMQAVLSSELRQHLTDWTKSTGKTKYQALKKAQKMAVIRLAPLDKRESIDALCKTSVDDIDKNVQTLMREIILLANTGPEEPELKLEWSIDKAADKRTEFNMSRLISLFLQGDIIDYMTQTGLNKEQAIQLHYLLADYIDKNTHLQHLRRIQNLLHSANNASPSELETTLFMLAQALLAGNTVNASSHPATSVFQQQANILLRPLQQKTLEQLLGGAPQTAPSEIIAPVNMGGGKTEVIIRLWTQNQADGTHLAFVEVPKALLKTYYAALRRSSALFHQQPYLFEFSRDSECSSKHLQNLHEHLTTVMLDKDYLLTTGESVQSLELKFIELLYKGPKGESEEGYHEWRNQIEWLKRLVLLFKHRGRGLIDEVHDGLILKNTLNYTLGEALPLPEFVRIYALDFYQFLYKINIGATNFVEALITRRGTADAHFIADSLAHLLSVLVKDPQSPLAKIIQDLRSRDLSIESIQAYISDTLEEMPPQIMNAPSEIKNMLAFYKEQFSSLLPFTLKRQQGEHYGPSQLSTLSPAQAMVAIPYVANNTPKEGSEFKDVLESMNYTICSTMKTGIPLSLLKIVLSDWLEQGRKEWLSATDIPSLKDTRAGRIYEGIRANKDVPDFNNLDPEDKVQLELVHQILGHDPELICSILGSHILPLISSNQSIAFSNAYSHVDLASSYQGLTGTPWNASTFHQRLKVWDQGEKDNDTYVIEAIKDKNPQIRGVGFSNLNSFVENMLCVYQPKDQVRSIIDLNASFTGINNLAVAKTLAHYIKNNPATFSEPEPLKFVLFFNENQELCALDVRKPIEEQEPILIGSTERSVIDARLNCGPGARFTYYDQAHTVGTNINQAPQIKGLVLVDQSIHRQNFTQASMRLRELVEGQQSIDLIVPPELSRASFDELIFSMTANQEKQLQQDNFHAAQQKMTNSIRTVLLQKLLYITDDTLEFKQQTFLGFARNYFIQIQSEDFFARYGQLSKNSKTADLLVQHKTALLLDLNRIMRDSGLAFSQEEHQLIIATLDKIIKAACEEGICSDEQKQPQRMFAASVETMQEKQTQTELRSEQHQQMEASAKGGYLEDYISWLKPNVPKRKKTTTDFEKLMRQFSAPTKAEAAEPELDWGRIPFDPPALAFKSLGKLCQKGGSYSPDFSPHIKASKNFYQTYRSQRDLLDEYMKPVYCLLFKRIDDKLECIILTQEEASEIYTEIEYSQEADYWISTTQHNLVIGNRPKDILANKEYLNIIEQVRYFNGQFNALSLEKELGWLQDNFAAKMQFYNQYIGPYRESSTADQLILQKKFPNLSSGSADKVDSEAKEPRVAPQPQFFPPVDKHPSSQENASIKANKPQGNLRIPTTIVKDWNP